MLEAMGWFRSGVLITSLAGAGLLAFGLADCAEPTQIVVEVYSDACEGTGTSPEREIHQVGIAVGKPGDIDNKPPSSLRDRCEKPPGVGTLTITPSGDKDEEIAIKVVGGVTRAADGCGPAPGYEGCIVHRRVTRFVPNTTQRAIVRLSLKCLNITCEPAFTCDNGECKRPEDLLPDGGTAPDAAKGDARVTPDATLADAGAPDACAACSDVCENGVCKVNCTNKPCAATELCSPNEGVT